MKGTTSLLAIALMLCGYSSSIAASSQEPEKMGFLTLLFIGFFALIVVMQLIPGIGLLVSMLSGLFSSSKKSKEVPVQSADK